MKHLAENGIWIVPAEERPKGWERYGLREANEPTSKPVEKTVLDKIIEEGQLAKPEPKAEVPAPPPKRAAPKAIDATALKEEIAELEMAVVGSGKFMGAEQPLINAGRIMICGLWSRDIKVIARALSLNWIDVGLIVHRLESGSIWLKD